MNRFYTLLAASLLAATSFGLSSQQLSETQTQWGKLFTNSASASFGTKLTSSGYGMVASTDGDIITLSNVGSTANTQQLLFGDAQVGIGSTYGGNACNLSLVISKIAADGTHKWSVYSTAGELDNSSSAIAATADGGVVAFLNMRHSEGDTGTRINLRDAAGLDHEVNFDITDDRSYRGLLVSIDSDGAISWMKEIAVNAEADADTYPKWTQSSRHIGQGLFAYAIALDNDGNIFIGGRMCAAITIDNTTILPHNVAQWNGSASVSAGNLFIAKFDASGNLLGHIETEGSATQESVRALKVVGNKIYAFCLIAGLANTDFSLGSKSVTSTNALISPALARLDTNLNVDFLQLYTTVKNGSVLQVPTMMVNDEHVYLMGTANFNINVAGTDYATSHTRDAWLFQVSADTGEPQQCYIHQANQTGFFGAYEAADGNLYVVEYGLTIYNGSRYTFDGNTTLYKFDQSDLSAPLDQAVLATHPSTGYGLLINGSNLFVYDRLVYNKGTGEFINSDLLLTSPSYVGRLAAYTVPVGAVEAVTLDKETVELEPGQSTQLIATFVPENTVKNGIVWTSSDESLVTVDENGVVTAAVVGAAAGARRVAGDVIGTATITATSASYPDLKASVEVSVAQATVTGITELTVTPASTGNKVFAIDGRYMGNSTDNLPAGIYIANGKKVVVR